MSGKKTNEASRASVGQGKLVTQDEQQDREKARGANSNRVTIRGVIKDYGDRIGAGGLCATRESNPKEEGPVEPHRILLKG